MTRTLLRVLGATLALSASIADAQTSSPVAYIYVSSNYSGDHNRVVGYAANAEGKLTEIPGSPWADNLSYLATTGGYLFGSTNIASDYGKNIFSYRVESNGALKYIGANNIQHTASENACNSARNLMLDHTGTYLYTFVHNEDNCNSNGGAYQSFVVDKSTGLLKYLGVTDPVGFYAYPPTMLADNDWAYAPQGNQGDGSGEICAYKKGSNGALVFTDSNSANECSNSGSPGLSNGQYWNVAADPTNQLAASMEFTDPNGNLVVKIATIAINTATGAQSSNSTYDNMPASDVQLILNSLSMVMAPSGKLLAVGGGNGIQVYNFDPNGQATPNTGLITRAPITAMYWDKSNHLYAISNADNTLHVFTVTATSTVEAPGSPYTIPHPVAMTGHSFATKSSTQYEASLSSGTSSGQVSINTSGQVTIQLSGAPKNTTYTVDFCPAYYGGQGVECFNVGTVSTGSTGSANISMKFPKSGPWAGDFLVYLPNTGAGYRTDYEPVFLAQLQPESTVNAGDLEQSGASQIPLASGNVTWSDGSFHFTLAGTSPDTIFYAIGSSGCLCSSQSYLLYDSQGQSTFTSNSSGNLSFSVLPSDGDLLQVESQYSQGLIGGFLIP